jgi:ABC-type multidrug transport system permease subunit
MNPATQKIALKIEGNFKENWGSPFILGFIFLLVIGSVLNFQNLVAVEIFNFSFYCLVAGVFLQFVCLLKDKRKLEETI